MVGTKTMLSTDSQWRVGFSWSEPTTNQENSSLRVSVGCRNKDGEYISQCEHTSVNHWSDLLFHFCVQAKFAMAGRGKEGTCVLTHEMSRLTSNVGNFPINPRLHPTSVGWSLGLTRQFPTLSYSAPCTVKITNIHQTEFSMLIPQFSPMLIARNRWLTWKFPCPVRCVV